MNIHITQAAVEEARFAFIILTTIINYNTIKMSQMFSHRVYKFMLLVIYLRFHKTCCLMNTGNKIVLRDQ